MSVASEHVFQGKKKQRSKQPPITSLQKKQKMTTKKKTWPSFLRIYKVMAKKAIVAFPRQIAHKCAYSPYTLAFKHPFLVCLKVKLTYRIEDKP
ncbi:MAG: hypothetical protein ACFWTW_00055 [Lentilactobacillus parabuchneri]|nr:hypothetical protein FAM21809_00539 [Lentilactobacillus parabuchneri]ORN13205.1 hypothetical protein FAM21838_00438 [Lentilactobacillus parabuchneri]ORN16748.1 hypothetical protein FAM23164_00506 [Lentilactobacillus parabuchneri]ORN18583.1 hypothetical protein FAM23165_00538 [Lentilactobacillus parabuchneri]ORN21693.1 hypothetical protein FAM23166_00480 [Lentilactobacillus parabuchneri]